ncbi:MAG: hypothetical protein ACLRWP_09780 [Bilophila wadsworthia]
MIVKKNADGSRDVCVFVAEGNPISGAAVYILGTNGLPVAEAAPTPAGGLALRIRPELQSARRRDRFW